MDVGAKGTAITDVTAAPGHEKARWHSLADERLGAADALIQLSRLVQDIHARISVQHNLTPVQAKLICILVFGSRGMAELAQLLGVEKAALTGLVDRAERRGLVSRSPVPGDRRALHVALTDAGRRAATAFHADATQQLNDLLSPLAPDDHETFRSAMAKVIAGSHARATAGEPA
jgi:DNA-binding MarR family transcriptional regulator